MSKTIFELPRVTPHHHLPDEIHILPDAHPSKIWVLSYGGAQVRDEQVEHVEDIERFLNKAPVVWIDVEGLGTLEVLQWLQEQFNLHPIHLNTALFHNLYPSCAVSPHYHVASYPQYMLDSSSQIVNLVIYKGANFLLTLHDKNLAAIEQTRDFIRHNEQASQSKPPEYLEYVLATFALQTYTDLAEYYHHALQNVTENSRLGRQSEYWHIFYQVQRLSNEFPWITRDLPEGSPFKPYWDAVNEQMSNLHDSFYALEQWTKILSETYHQKIEARQLLFLQIIAGLLAILLILILLTVIL